MITFAIGARYHPLCTATIEAGQGSIADHNGGSARGYQAIFVPSTALASPGYDGQPVVYLYIAALEVNALNCRGQGRVPRARHTTGRILGRAM